MFSRDVLDAERELGRLTELLSESEVAPLWRADSIRREVVGSYLLDGIAVEMEDLAVARIDGTLLPVLQREVLDEPAGLSSVLEDLIADRRREVDDTPLPPASRPRRPAGSRDIAALLQQVRAATASVEAFVSDLDGAASPPPSPANLPRLPPLSQEWFREAWFSLTGEEIPAPVLAAGLSAAGELASRPGLPGVISALVKIHQASPSALDRSDFSTDQSGTHPDRRGWRYARMIAPFLFRLGCGLPVYGPYLSWSFRRDPRDYARMISAPDGHGDKWLAGLLPDALRFERDRVQRILKIIEGWERRFGSGGKRRWQTNISLISSFVETPVVTTKSLHRVRGGDLRSAQMLLKDLRDCGIVDLVHHGKGREWFVASDILLR